MGAVLLWLDQADWVESSRIRKQGASYFLVGALIVIGFLLVSPITYGLEAPEWYLRILIEWVRSFR